MSRKCKKTIFAGCFVANVFTMLKWRLFIMVAVMGLLILRPVSVEAVSYTFIDIANTNNPNITFTHFRDAPAINNSGTAAFGVL